MKNLYFGMLLFGSILLLIASILKFRAEETNIIEQKSTCKEDSLNFVILELTIEKGRYEIIIDRIRQADSAIVDAASTNLE